ncbi:hypothetical protein C8R43DRAFT_925102 [Mycena crocata]|nr:hypothetical protein C8R43DRAFT_925102 [Mycena crocata]
MPSICKSCSCQTGIPKPDSTSELTVSVAADSPAAHRRRLEDVGVQILRLQAQIDALERERGELQRKLATVVYPILTLPTEITSEIFVQCLPLDRRIRPSEGVAPLVLTKVCRYFREVTLATPGMWSSLSLDFDNGWDDTTTIAFETGLTRLVERWFSRAGSQPLSFTLRNTQRIFPAILRALAKFPSQWRRLEVDGLAEDVALLEEICGDLPTLRQLGLTSPFAPGDGFLGAPQLSEVRIRLAGGLLHTSANMRSLISLRIDYVDLRLSQFLDILDGCPRLLQLDCAVPFVRGEASRPTPLPIHRLTSLSLRCPCDALLFVSLPELQHLKTYADCDYGWNSGAFAAWSKVASCSLRHLTLWGLSVWDWDLVMEDIGAFPTLISLEIRKMLDTAEEYGWNGTFTALDSPDLLPNLTALKIVEPAPKAALRNILCLLMERREHSLRLEDVEIVLDEWMLNIDFSIRMVQAQFADLIAGGLNLRITASGSDEEVKFP